LKIEDLWKSLRSDFFLAGLLRSIRRRWTLNIQSFEIGSLMAKIYLVRHGQAAAGWGQELDPGLDDKGRVQAKAAAEKLAPLGPLPIISSPRARARQTAHPLAEIWNIKPVIEDRVGEIRFPSETPADRIPWLKEIMVDQWSNLDPDLQQWRREVIEALLTIETDTVVFTHYIAINAAVGHAIEGDRVVLFQPE
jgi:broad specificity phosphatase PhoE